MKIKIKKFDWRNLILFVLSILFSIGIIEIALRIIIDVQPGYLNKYYQSNEYISDNKYWKVWHYPNNFTIHKSDCFYGEYETNKYGMKGDEVDPLKPKIALIGDSFVEGYGESNRHVVSHYLDSLLDHSYQVLNFGTSGGFGTVHEVSLYENFARYFDPEIVVLCFLNYNDLYDNVKAIEEGYINKNGDFIYPKSKSFDEIRSYLSNLETPPRNTENEGGLITYKMAMRGIRSLGDFLQLSFDMRIFDFREKIAEVYMKEPSENIKKGYEVFGKSLKRLKQEVKKDSAQLLLVQIAGPFQTDEGWLSTTEKRVGKKLNPTIPNDRVRQICNKIGVDYLDLYPDTKDYISKNEMEYPFLYHSCDRHHNPEGNLVMAQFIYKYLMKSNYLK